MKNFFTILMSTLAGIFFGLWVSERQRRLETAAQGMSSPQSIVREPRKDRTPEEISPGYKNRRESIGEYNDDEIAEHLDSLAKELIQPGLTPLEAERVANAMSEVARSALNYDVRRERVKSKAREARADEWLNDLDTEGENSDD